MSLFEIFQIFLKILIGIKPNSFWAFTEHSKSDTFGSDTNYVTFEKVQIFMENIIGIIPNTFRVFLKNVKSDTFENYKSFVPLDVQNQTIWIG